MPPRTTIGAALFALLLVTSTGAVALSSSTTFDATTADVEDAAPETADAVYVDETGDAVLAYERAAEYADQPIVERTGEFGVDVESGLVHLFYSGAFADAVGDAPQLTGDATARATPDLVSGDADLLVDPPDDLVDVAAEIDHTRTRTTYDSSTSVSMVVEREGDGDDRQFATPVDLGPLAYTSIDLETETTTTASTLDARGSLRTVAHEDALFADPDGTDERLAYTITEDSDGYHLSVTERTAVTDWQKDRWDTREDAERTLESRYVETAIGLDGTTTVSLESYDFDEAEDDDNHVVSVDYEVTLSGVESRAAELLAEELADATELDLTDEEARTLADRIANLQVERVHVSRETDGLETTVKWDVEIERYDEFLLGVFAIAESIDELDDDLASQLDERRALFDAQAEADLVRTSSLAATVATDPDADRTTYEFSSRASADNWEAYVEEVEARGLGEHLRESSSDLTVDTDGDAVELAVELEVERDGVVDLDAAIEDALETARVEPLVDEHALEQLEDLRGSTFETAKANVSFDERAVSMRSAARFDDLTTFETGDELTVTGVHGETDGDVTTVYVSVADFVDVDEGVSESAVREHDRVDEDTAVYMPGEWDREDLPQTDVASVTEYLDEDDTDSSFPVGMAGIAIGLSVIAVLSGVAYRRLR